MKTDGGGGYQTVASETLFVTCHSWHLSDFFWQWCNQELVPSSLKMPWWWTGLLSILHSNPSPPWRLGKPSLLCMPAVVAAEGSGCVWCCSYCFFQPAFCRYPNKLMSGRGLLDDSTVDGIQVVNPWLYLGVAGYVCIWGSITPPIDHGHTWQLPCTGFTGFHIWRFFLDILALEGKSLLGSPSCRLLSVLPISSATPTPVTSLILRLHWLLVTEGISFNCHLLTYKAPLPLSESSLYSQANTDLWGGGVFSAAIYCLFVFLFRLLFLFVCVCLFNEDQGFWTWLGLHNLCSLRGSLREHSWEEWLDWTRHGCRCQTVCSECFSTPWSSADVPKRQNHHLEHWQRMASKGDNLQCAVDVGEVRGEWAWHSKFYLEVWLFVCVSLFFCGVSRI